MIRQKPRAAFSLIELIVSVSILAVLTTLALSNMRGSTARVGVQGLAVSLAEDLRATREHALASRQPSALLIPTTGATGGASSWYFLSGFSSPIANYSHSQTSQAGTLAVCACTWPGPAFIAGPTTLPGSKWTSFSLPNWLSSVTDPSLASHVNQDSCFLFLPDGTVLVNNIQMLAADQTYRVVVSGGLTTSGGALAQAADPWTVSVTQAGDVSSSYGLPSVGAGVVVAGQYTGGTLAAQVPTTTYNDVLPSVGTPIVYPPPNPTVSTASTFITSRQFVSLSVTAQSLSGRPLYCTWVSTPLTNTATIPPTPPSATPGAFSYASSGGGSGAAMEWDPTQNAYVSRWQWRPPVGAQPGQLFEINAQVSNVGSPAVQVTVQKQVQIAPPGAILFETDAPTAIGVSPCIWSMNPAGGGWAPYLYGYSQPTATPNGKRICCMNATSGDIVMIDTDNPNHPEIVVPSTGALSVPTISPLGNRVAYRDGDYLKVVNVVRRSSADSGSYGSPVKLTKTPIPLVAPAPYSAGRTNLQGRFYQPLSAAATMQISGSSQNAIRPGYEKLCWDPTGTFVLFSTYQTDRLLDASGNPSPFHFVGGIVKVALTSGATPALDTSVSPNPQLMANAYTDGRSDFPFTDASRATNNPAGCPEDGPAHAPTWCMSPSSGTVFYVTNGDDSAFDPHLARIDQAPNPATIWFAPPPYGTNPPPPAVAAQCNAAPFFGIPWQLPSGTSSDGTTVAYDYNWFQNINSASEKRGVGGQNGALGSAWWSDVIPVPGTISYPNKSWYGPYIGAPGPYGPPSNTNGQRWWGWSCESPGWDEELPERIVTGDAGHLLETATSCSNTLPLTSQTLGGAQIYNVTIPPSAAPYPSNSYFYYTIGSGGSGSVLVPPVQLTNLGTYCTRPVSCFQQ